MSRFHTEAWTENPPIRMPQHGGKGGAFFSHRGIKASSKIPHRNIAMPGGAQYLPEIS